jgi:hypothetical protein
MFHGKAVPHSDKLLVGGNIKTDQFRKGGWRCVYIQMSVVELDTRSLLFLTFLSPSFIYFALLTGGFEKQACEERDRIEQHLHRDHYPPVSLSPYRSMN